MHEIGETCLASSPFNISAFLNGALKMGRDMDYLRSIQTIPTTSEDAQPTSLPSASPSSSSSSSSDGTSGRKRRRGEVANPANTLDGLVARRADDIREPFQKRYLSEQEAIEGPDDDDEIKKMEGDPDVSTKTCSICGYEGKWVSEMIRHKRVHTSLRPFKCRFCSRTSKWKADLIRHVAKTHGIRVVSKYSRSKAFDSNSALLNQRGPDDKPIIFGCDADCDGHEHSLSPPAIHRPQPVTPGKSPLSYRCVQCLFEQDGLSVMLNHLRVVHNCLPYECRNCGLSFEEIGVALRHSSGAEGCSSNDLKVNITPIYNKNKAQPSAILSYSPGSRSADCSPDSGLEMDDDNQNYQSAMDNRAGLSMPMLTPTGLTPLHTAFTASPLVSPLMDQSLLTPPTSLDFASALMALQSCFNQNYLASMTSLLSSMQQTSAFTPVTRSAPSVPVTPPTTVLQNSEAPATTTEEVAEETEVDVEM